MSAATRRLLGALLLIVTMGSASCSAFLTSCSGYLDLATIAAEERA